MYIEFFSKKTQLGKLVQKIPFAYEQKGYKKLLVSSGSTSDMEKISTQDEYENAMEGDMDLNKNQKIR